MAAGGGGEERKKGSLGLTKQKCHVLYVELLAGRHVAADVAVAVAYGDVHY